MAYPPAKKFFYVWIFILSLFFLVISFLAKRDLFGFPSLVSSFIYPFQLIASTSFKTVERGFWGIVELRKVAQENISLKQELTLVRSQIKLLEELKQENLRLKNILGFKNHNPYHFKLLAAKIIGKSPTPWFSTLLLNQGKSAGVKEGLTVIAPEGLVGKIIEVSPVNAKVLLLIDPDSAVAATSLRSRDFGVAEGVFPNKLHLKYVKTQGDIQVGDTIVVSSLSSLNLPGIPLGQVFTVTKGEADLFFQIELKPAVNFSQLEEVFIVLR